MKIIGVDPGSRLTGYGVLEMQAERKWRVLGHGVVKAPIRGLLHERLGAIYTGVMEILEAFEPEVMVVEEVFYAHDVRSALTLGHVRGVILLAGCQRQIPVASYATRRVKQAISGSGRADKLQVKRMVARLLSVGEDLSADAADALAIALCHAQSHRLKGVYR